MPRSHVAVAQIYAELREQIVSMVLEPGAGLSETRIGESYGVSRTPVREAFKRLAEDGFLEVVPQVGTFVARIDLAVVHSNLFVRETLECRIVELAAERIDADQRAWLGRNLADQQAATDAQDGAGFFRHDEAMHRRLAAIAGHDSAWSVIHAAKGQLDRVRRLSLADHIRVRTRMAEHHQIVDRVSAGDSVGAAQAMRVHVRSALDAIAKISADKDMYFVNADRVRVNDSGVT